MSNIVLLIVLISSITVLIDAKRLGITARIGSGVRSGPWGWFFGCLLFWIISFPLYLWKRGAYCQALGKGKPSFVFSGFGVVLFSIGLFGIYGQWILSKAPAAARATASASMNYSSPAAALMDGENAIGKHIELSGQALNIRNIRGDVYVDIYSGGETWVLKMDPKSITNKDAIAEAVQTHQRLTSNLNATIFLG